MIDKKKDFTELLQGFRDIYENQVPFNRMLGLKLESLSENDVCIKFEMKDELIGNFVDGVLHGGVISAVLDTVGALTALAGILTGMKILQIDHDSKNYVYFEVNKVYRYI